AELKSPLLRARYLMSLSGIEGSGEASITRDPTFLMQQIELREALSEVREASEPFVALGRVAEEARGQYADLQREFGQQYSQTDVENAIDTVAKMQFFSKLLNEVEQFEEELDDE
ncbi:MAG: Fe-S protein assembly co-chaperone HscB, partial [Porticoccus sp.]